MTARDPQQLSMPLGYLSVEQMPKETRRREIHVTGGFAARFLCPLHPVQRIPTRIVSPTLLTLPRKDTTTNKRTRVLHAGCPTRISKDRNGMIFELHPTSSVTNLLRSSSNPRLRNERDTRLSSETSQFPTEVRGTRECPCSTVTGYSPCPCHLNQWRPTSLQIPGTPRCRPCKANVPIYR